MKHTFATMLLTALLCAVAAPGMAQGEQPNVYYGNTDGGTVKFYGAKPTSNSTPEEITQAEPGSTVYFVPVPDAFHTTEGLQLQAVKTADSDVAEIPRRGVGYAQDIEIVTDVAGSLYHFTMPAGGVKVMVTATFPKRTQKVIYLDPTKPAGQQECEVEAYILDKQVSELPGSGEEGTWYVCTTPATDNEGKGLVIDGTLTIQNNVNLILADGCKMTVSAGIGLHIENSYYGYGFLSIYAQSTGDAMGQLVATSNSDYGICLSILAINGGAITASGPERGILYLVVSNERVLSINGGRVTATGTGDRSYGIESHSKMSITGGQVTATGTASGINVPTGGLDITLSSADDFVEASGYYFGVDTEAHELHLGAVGTDGSGCYLASTPGQSDLTPFAYIAGGITLSADQQAAIAGKRIALATEVVTYIDANGELQNIATDTYSGDSDTPQHYTENDFTYVITGSETSIGADGKTTWYVCDKPHSYKSQFGIRGKMHLILTERGIVDVIPDNDATAVIGYDGADLNIYGQSLTRGYFIAIAKGNHAGIDIPGSFTLNSGYVTARGNYGLKSGSAITINDGFMMTEGSDVSIDCVGDFTFNGGQFAARSPSGTGIVSSNGNIVLGWSDPNDYIYAKSFSCEKGQLSATEGKRFVAYKTEKNPDDESFDHNVTTNEATAIVSGTAGTDGYTFDDIGGKTLRPIDGNLVSTPEADIVFGYVDSEGAQQDKASDFEIDSGAGTEADPKVTTYYNIYKKDDPVTLSYAGSDFVMLSGLPEGTTLAAVEGQPMQRSFTMPAVDVVLTTTSVTGLTATPVIYNGTARTPEIKQGDDVFAPANYTIAYQLGEEAVAAANVKNGGTYTCTLTGLGQYVGTTNVPFVIKRTTSIAVEIVDPVTTVDGHPVIIAGDDAHVKVTLVPVKGENETTVLPAINGIVTISVDNGTNNPKSYTVAIVNGVGHYYVTNLAQDAYAITASFAGDANHAASTTENATTLEVCMILTETTCSLDKTEINVGEAVNVTVHVNEVGLQQPVIDSETGKNKEYRYPEADVKPLSIDDVILMRATTPSDNEQGNYINNYNFAIVNGQCIMTYSHLPAGPRFFFAVFAGTDDRYIGSRSTVENLQVNKTDTIVGVSVTSPVIAK